MPSPSTDSAAPARVDGLTWRSLFLGLILIAVVCRWIHEAELVVGQRGHSALANTSIPLGAFGGLLLVMGLNAVLKWLAPKLVLGRGEVLVIYVMMTTGTVLASSGGIHFLVPAILAPFYFATPENHLDLIAPYVPKWFAPQDPQAILDFYRGNATVPYHAWIVPAITWTTFLLLFVGATVSLSALLRRQWVDRERLTFPTVILPLEMTRVENTLWRNPAMWMGFGLAATVGIINNLHANLPLVPDLRVRYIPLDQGFTSKFTQAMKPVGISFYPFVIGIGYLLSLDVTLSCVLFYWLGKLQAGLAAQIGLSDSGSALGQFPYLQEQGAGAFLALCAFSLWFARGTIKEMLQTAFGRDKPLDESIEPMSYRTAFLSFLGCFGGLLIFCAQAHMSVILAAVVLFLSLAFLVAATRIRAETGNAWLYGPMMDPNRLVLTATRGNLPLRDLTMMAFLRSVSSFDMRCQSMPHQLDAFKMADAAHLQPRQVTTAIVIAIAFAVPVALMLALRVWYAEGALGKAEPWRTTMGRVIFEEIIGLVMAPPKHAGSQLAAVSTGFGITLLLTWFRSTWVTWPLHPIGYAIAGTNTMKTVWMPFFLAWLIKGLTLKWGGMKAYRRAIPFFLGLILGDFVCGATATGLACFLPNIKIYPINW